MGTLAKGFHDQRYRDLIEVLVSRRRTLRLSQEEVAKRLGRHQQFVSRYELGERRLDVVEFADVAHGLGLVPADLVMRIALTADEDS